MNTTEHEEILEKLEEKFQAINQKTETHLEGLLWAKPITYWDYIQTDALLNLQIQRTTLPDEMVFVMYHQVNELLFKMILWEIEQVCHSEKPETAFFTEKLMRSSVKVFSIKACLMIFTVPGTSFGINNKSFPAIIAAKLISAEDA